MLKKLLAFFEVVLVVFLVILIIAIFTFYISFSKENSVPKIFGNSFFILNTDDMQNENGTGINKGSLVIASDDELDSLKEGMVVLCDINDVEGESAVYNVLRIYAIEPGNETTKYTVSNEKMASNRTYIIEKDKIVAKCKYSSDTLGQIIAFSKTTQGILILIILPCIVLIALQIVHIVARAKRNRFETAELETFEFPSDMTFPDDEQSPLYAPKKLDFAQKVDVEENFSNKYEEDIKKGKSKSFKKHVDDETKRSDEKERNFKDSEVSESPAMTVDSELEETAESAKKEKSKAKFAVEIKDNDIKEEKNIAEEKASDKIKISNAEVEYKADEKLSDVPEIVEERVSPSEEKIDNSEMIAEESEQISDIKLDKSFVDKTEAEQISELDDIKTQVVFVENKPKDSDKKTADVAETDKPKSETAAAKVNPAPVKKKTPVKKRATVRKGPSASATDLLKAIDTESKKLSK